MILPTKNISQDRALLTVGARILALMDQPLTVSALWDAVLRQSNPSKKAFILHYDAFVLTLDLLYMMGALDLQDGVLHKKKQ